MNFEMPLGGVTQGEARVVEVWDKADIFITRESFTTTSTGRLWKYTLRPGEEAMRRLNLEQARRMAQENNESRERLRQQTHAEMEELYRQALQQGNYDAALRAFYRSQDNQ